MAKESGLNVRLYVSGYDLSGDANTLSTVGYTNEQYDVTTLSSAATARLLGKVDGTMTLNGYFDNAAGKIHAILSGNSGKIPTADVNVLVPLGSAIGDPAYGLLAKEAEYNVDRSDTGPITVTSSFASNGYGPEFGVMMTAYFDTFSSASSGTVVDDNGAATSNGGAGYLQVSSLASGSVTVKVQDCASSGGTYADLVTFTTVAAASAPTAERVEASGAVARYVKVTTTGTFSNAVIAVGFARL